jgi:competence protein ComEA
MADDPAEVATDAEIQQRFGRVTGLPPAPDDPVPDVEPARRPRLAAFDPGRRGVRALAMVAAAVVCIAAFIAWQARPRAMPMPQATALPASAGANAAAPASGTASVVVVAVAGRVRKPGLIRLPSGSRVADAIEAAGGVLPDTDLSFINLARKVVDGELIVVGVTPPPGAAGGAPGATGAPGGPINLNTATVAELQTLPGIGAVLAQRIIDYRTKHGQFRSVDELRQVEGIGEAKFAQLKDRVTV